jgi:hypothetical protein
MFYACFQLLKEFVEKEDPQIGLRTKKDFGSANKDWDPHWDKSVKERLTWEAEIRELYDWWMTKRKQEWDKLDEIDFDIDFKPFNKDGRKFYKLKKSGQWKKYRKYSDYLDNKDEEMFMKLINIRKRLWT